MDHYAPITRLWRQCCAALIACAAGSFASGAQAATAASTMPVSATVQATCSINANPLSFGTYTSAQLDAATTIGVNCTNTTTYNISLDAGSGSAATVAQRKMSNGSQTLNYTVYMDASRSSVWGATVTANTVAGTGTGANQTLNVYGRIPAGQLPTPGSYADTLTATIIY